MALTQARNALIARSILKELKRRYGRVKVVSDSARWYPWAAKTLALEHEVISGTSSADAVSQMKFAEI
jgi:transposase-like protein